MNDTEISNNLPADEVSNGPDTHERYREGAPMERLIRGWRMKRKEDIHRKVSARSAATSRMKYRIERASGGKTVRPYSYHEHEPQQVTESREEYERRLHRDRARAKRGVNAQTVRGWTDMSLMSPEEKLLHKRKLANERKARSRKQPSRSPTDNTTNVAEDLLSVGDIEWGMF
ncbi:hypothetical protein [Rhizobium mayense]|uniref:hypothetical protein n=1 Tax=Rhizobium mayense TaxID=1312184 RepID=UPI00398C7C2B